jgi:hypothetical protein
MVPRRSTAIIGESDGFATWDICDPRGLDRNQVCAIFDRARVRIGAHATIG